MLFAPDMDKSLQSLLALPHLEYIVFNADWTIVETSAGVQRFGDDPDDVAVGKDARLGFPELFGLDEVVRDLVARDRRLFSLKGIARLADSTAMFYVDLYLLPKTAGQGQAEQGVTMLVRDATERMATERDFGQIAKEYSLALTALESAKNYTDRVLQAMTDALFVITPTGRIVTVNEAAKAVFGYDESELLMQPITHIARDPLLEKVLSRTGRIPVEGLIGDFQCRTQSGELREVEFSCAALVSPDREGEIEAFVCIGRDVTARKRMEAQLYQQGQQDLLIGRMMQRIRQSLSLSEILDTTVREVRQSLGLDRALVLQLQADTTVQVVAESVGEEVMSVRMRPDFSDRVADEWLARYRRGEMAIVADVNRCDGVTSICRETLRQADAQACLSIPILAAEPRTDADEEMPVQLWGVVVAHQRRVRHWDSWEVELLRRLAEQLAIAIAQAELYAQLEAAKGELERLAIADGLTQIANRRHFNNTLAAEWTRLSREAQPLALILCDIDDFKAYNDTYGHVAGDACLQRVAAVLQEAARRPADLAARYGGEEFAIVLPNTTLDGAVAIAESVRSQLWHCQIPHRASRASDRLTLSLGVASAVPQPGSSPEHLLKAADWALYQAKLRGRNGYCIYPRERWQDADNLTRNLAREKNGEKKGSVSLPES